MHDRMPLASTAIEHAHARTFGQPEHTCQVCGFLVRQVNRGTRVVRIGCKESWQAHTRSLYFLHACSFVAKALASTASSLRWAAVASARSTWPKTPGSTRRSR